MNMATVLDKVTYNNGNPVYTPFPTPVEVAYTLSTMDASSSGRNQSGLMFRDVIANKVKIQVKWGPLSESQMSTILNLVDAPFFDLRYPDAKLGAKRIMTCYVGDRSTPMYRQDSDSSWKWKDLSISFIER